MYMCVHTTTTVLTQPPQSVVLQQQTTDNRPLLTLVACNSRGFTPLAGMTTIIWSGGLEKSALVAENLSVYSTEYGL